MILYLCVQLLFLREIQVLLDFWAAKEKKGPKVSQDIEEYQGHKGSEGKQELQESQVCFALEECWDADVLLEEENFSILCRVPVGWHIYIKML